MQAELPQLLTRDRMRTNRRTRPTPLGRRRRRLHHHLRQPPRPPRTQQPGIGSILHDRRQVLEQRRIRDSHLLGVIDHQPLRELQEQRLHRAALQARLLVQHDHRRLQPIQRITLRRRRPQRHHRSIDLLFEQAEHQLVLPVEVLVEAPQRLLRTINHLLHRELGRVLLGNDLPRRVQEPLHPLRRPQPRRLRRAINRPLPPRRLLLLLAIARHPAPCTPRLRQNHLA